MSCPNSKGRTGGYASTDGRKKSNHLQGQDRTRFPGQFHAGGEYEPLPLRLFNHPEKECSCAPGVVEKYLNKISGPLLDRIDLHVEVTPVPLIT